jgi:DNA-binding NarL/FixJ family response regulator
MRETIDLEDDLTVVTQAAELTTAVAAAMSSNPDVALVDVRLPNGSTGLALIEELSSRTGRAVVAMSVRNDFGPAALSAGALAFVEKRTDIDAVLNAVRRAAWLVAP